MCQADDTETGDAVSAQAPLQSDDGGEAYQLHSPAVQQRLRHIDDALRSLVAINHDDAELGSLILAAMTCLGEAKDHIQHPPRAMTGILSTMSPEQLAAAFSYDGPEYLGSECRGPIEERSDTASPRVDPEA